MLDAYKHVLAQLCKQGLPTGNIFEYASIVVKNYEKQLNHFNSEDNEKEPLEENEINEDNLNDLNDEQNILNNDINNEDIYNPENGENNNDYNYFLYKNILKEQDKEREEEVVDKSMDVIEGEDNFFDNINEINNEYEIYNENQNQEEEEEKKK